MMKIKVANNGKAYYIFDSKKPIESGLPLFMDIKLEPDKVRQIEKQINYIVNEMKISSPEELRKNSTRIANWVYSVIYPIIQENMVNNDIKLSKK